MSSLAIPVRAYTYDDVCGVSERISHHVDCPRLFGRASLPDTAFLNLIFSKAIACRSGNEFVRAGNKADGKTRLVEPEKVLKKLRLTEETYISYSLHKRGQKDENVTRLIALSIDLDAKHQPGGIATDAQIQKVCELVPGAVVIAANGVQVILRPPSQNWSDCCSQLVALGEYLAAETGLEYDRGCHITADNRPAAHRGHAYRGPGVAKKAGRKVLLLHPCTDYIATTTDALATLGLQPAKLLPALPPVAEPIKKRATRSFQSYSSAPSSRGAASIPRVTTPRTGSFGPKYEEFSEASRQLHALLRTGVPQSQAITQIAGQSWEYLKAGELEKSFTAYVADWNVTGTGKGKFLANVADQEIFSGYLVDTPTLKQRRMQKTFGLFAHRAWAMDHFYNLGFTEEEAITAFLRWSIMRRIRRASIKALGGTLAARQYLRADLARIYSKYADGGGARPADPELVAKVLSYCQSIGTPFKATAIPRHEVGVTSQRHLRRILGLLVANGDLTKTGTTKNRMYVVATGIMGEKGSKNPPQTPHPIHLSKFLCMAESFSASPTPTLPMNTPPPTPATPPKKQASKPAKAKKSQFKELKKPKTWDYSATFEEAWYDALQGMGDGLSYHGIALHEFADEVGFSELYHQVYKEICTKVEDRKRTASGPSLSRLYAFLAKNNRKFSEIGPVLSDLVYEQTVSASYYREHAGEYPRALGDGVEKIERSGQVSFVDYATKAVKLNVLNIVSSLNNDQGIKILDSLELDPWPRATRKTLLLLWEFGIASLKEWMSRQLGEDVPVLWLGWKQGHGGKPLVMEADGDLLSYIVEGTKWDEQEGRNRRDGAFV